MRTGLAHTWANMFGNPWWVALIVLVGLIFAHRTYRFFRWLPLSLAPRDPRRRFTGADRAFVLERAGGRCEQRLLFGGRCSATDELQIDHIHPYSRGGSTTVGNAQVLCARHNRTKGSRVPYNRSLRALERRRSSYFPPGADRAVVRRAGRQA